MHQNNKVIRFIGIVIAILIVALVIYSLWYDRVSAPSSQGFGAPVITTTTGNYGLFIDNQDNEYFSTHDANVRNIIETYLTNKDGKTDAEKYGYSLVYYYTKDVFIAEGLFLWSDLNSVSGFTMHDMKTGKPISDCTIIARAGLHKDTDLLLSASYVESGLVTKQGVCLYERGASSFVFVDLSARLAKNESLFDDPAGQDLHASIHDVDTQKKTFIIDVYDSEKKGTDGRYMYKKSMSVPY